MQSISKLFGQPLSVVNVGVERFYDAMRLQATKTVQVQWKPVANGDAHLQALLAQLNFPEEGETMGKIEAANQEALARINRAEPELVDIRYAHEVLPELDKFTVCHAGPPLNWTEMCGPLKGAVLGALVYEGTAATLEEAEALVQAGKIKFVSNHSVGCVGPMTGIITYSMPVYQVLNKTYGNTAYCTFNEGLGKVMRFGANDETVITRLRWLETILAPAMKKALALSGPISLKVMIAKALAMGDEMHQRNIAASSLFARSILPYLVRVVDSQDEMGRIADFITGNDQLFLNLVMAAGKSIMDPVKNIPYCTVVTAMSRNGTNFGIKVSALGEQWFEAPVNMPVGLYFPGYSEKDANPDIGDSAITETFGIGGFAMGAAPAVVRFVGAGSAAEAAQYTRSMGEITVGRGEAFCMPAMDFIGTPTGIDIRRVVETGILPVINTGVAHKKPGVGQIGAGIVRAPLDCFVRALEAFAAEMKRFVP